MTKKSKTVSPAPVFVANYVDGLTVRMSFASPAGKPIDLAVGKTLCDLVRAGIEYVPDAGLDFDEQAYAKAAFRRAYEAPASKGDMVYHPSFGLKPVEQLNKPTAVKAPNTVKLLSEVRDEIRNAVDAESALARIATLLGLDTSVNNAAINKG